MRIGGRPSRRAAMNGRYSKKPESRKNSVTPMFSRAV
jgi:hypothetical protein